MDARWSGPAVLLALLATACGDPATETSSSAVDVDTPTTASESAGQTGERAPSSPARAAEAPPIDDDEPSAYPRAAIGRLSMTPAGFNPRALGYGFLTRRGDQTVMATARHLAGPDGGLSTELELSRFEFEITAASLELATGPVALGAPACAAIDHWSSDVLLLEAPVDRASAIAPAAARPQLDDAVLLLLGDALTPVAGNVVEVYDDAFFEIELAADTPSLDLGDIAGLPVLDADGRATGVISELRLLAGGRTGIAAQALAPFLTAPERLAGVPLVPLADFVERAALSLDGRLLAVGSPSFGRLRVFERASGAIFAPLESLDRGRRLSVGVFTPDGYTLIAAGRGRVELYELRSGIPLAVTEELAGTPQILVADDARALVTSEAETLLIDLDSFTVRGHFPASTALAADGSGALLAGFGDGRVQRLDVEVADDGRTTLVEEDLTPRAAEEVTALAATVDRLAIGRGNDLVVLSRGADGRTLHRLATGDGPINALAFAAGGRLLLVATGQLLEDDAGDLVAADCYVRVLETATWREVARSHDHWSPVVALAREGDGRWLSLCADGETFSWTLPTTAGSRD